MLHWSSQSVFNDRCAMADRVSRPARTRLSKGKQTFLDSSVDGRTLIARRFREVLASIVSDLGGADAMSEAEMVLARRAVTLVVTCETHESKLAETGKLDSEAYLPCVNALAKLLNALGLKRRPKHVGPSPLEGYHASNSNSRDADVVDVEPEHGEHPAPRRINKAIAAVAIGSDSPPRRIIRYVRR